jgi:DUF1680 family protein
MELALYNSVLSGISLDGKNFLYTNPLSYSSQLPFNQRWSKVRVPYISLSNCCPPNVVRTIAEVSNYVYSLSDKGLYINLYGGNALQTKDKDGNRISVQQQTSYPWNGLVKIVVQDMPLGQSIFLRIPGWADGGVIKINGKLQSQKLSPGSYAELKYQWKKGDVIELNLPMKAKLMEANPLVEENRNQVAVKFGPIVYCLESVDLPKNENIFNLLLSSGNVFQQQLIQINGAEILSLSTVARKKNEGFADGVLYKELKPASSSIRVRLIPYFAWGNRGKTDMTVWLPVSN